jgi:hypothetical protein
MRTTNQTQRTTETKAKKTATKSTAAPRIRTSSPSSAPPAPGIFGKRNAFALAMADAIEDILQFEARESRT